MTPNMPIHRHPSLQVRRLSWLLDFAFWFMFALAMSGIFLMVILPALPEVIRAIAAWGTRFFQGL